MELKHNFNNCCKQLFSDTDFNIQYDFNKACTQCYCDTNNIENIKVLINNNNNLQIQCGFESACSNNCCNCCIKIIRYLLEIKADINIQEGFIEACINNNIALIKYLLEINPCLDIQKAFTYACTYNNMCNNFDTLKYLLEIKPDLDIQEKFNDACYFGDDIEKISFLLKIKPDLDIQKGFDIACEYIWIRSLTSQYCTYHFSDYYTSNIDTIKYLLGISDLDVSKPFEYACSGVNNNIEIIRYILLVVPNLDIREYLDMAYSNKKLLTVDFLFEKNKNEIINPILNFVINNKFSEIKISECLYISGTVDNKLNNTCSICFDSLANIQTNCNHLYCYSCINNWYHRNTTCPTCRNTLKECFILF